ncbi:MAG TPA: trigger factor [Clostridia bacterium]|nr:trigger factor [Clostridia bacterium]
MNVTIESQQPGKRVLLVEVEEDRVKQAIDEAYRQVSRTTMIPGFRKGKAPRNIIDMHVGKASIRERALEGLLSQCYKEALAETGVEPFGAPEMEIVDFEEGKPLRFRAKFEVKPSAKLGQYKGLGVVKSVPEISTKAVLDELEKMRKNKAELVDLGEEGEVQPGKVAFLDFRMPSRDSLDEEAKKLVTRSLQEISPGGYLIKPLEECSEVERQLIGMRSGEERQVSIDSFTVLAVVTAVKELRLPDLDDEFARSVGPFENLEELKKSIENNLRHLAEEETSKKVREEILDRIAEKASFEIPESLVEKHLDYLVNTMREVGAKLYEQNTDAGKKDIADVFSEERMNEVRERNRPRIQQEIKRELVIHAVALEEGIEADEDEFYGVLAKMAQERQMDFDTFVNEMAKSHGLESVRTGILREKVLEFLERENVAGEDKGEDKAKDEKEDVRDAQDAQEPKDGHDAQDTQEPEDARDVRGAHDTQNVQGAHDAQDTQEKTETAI